MDQIRLLSAFQVLTLPEGSYGEHATHDKARQIIFELTGKHVTTTPPKQDGLDAYLEWLEDN